MIKTNSTRKYTWHLIPPFLLVLFSGFQPGPQSIVLHDEVLPVSPKEFYVANVVDERENRAAVAWLLPVADSDNNQGKTSPVDFQGGGLAAIKQFIDHSLPRNTSLRPVIIRLKRFIATETALPGGHVDGRVTFAMSFDLQRGNQDALHLGDYNGSARYNRKAGAPQAIEPTLRHVLTDGLVYLNSWMDQQANSNVNLAKEVKIDFTNYSEKKEGDTIYYTVKRPITWDDFKSKIPDSKFDAETFPGIGYEEHAAVNNAVLNVHLAIKVYLPKSACWVKSGSRTDFALNHEQKHFDIAKIAAEHFKKKLSTEHFTVSNFEGPINVEYLEALREMNRLQKQYDDETKHGLDQGAQQRWNERIDKELKELGVKEK